MLVGFAHVPNEHSFDVLFGLKTGQRLNASEAASAKSSRVNRPSCLPNFDMPALTIVTSGFPFKPDVLLPVPLQ
jgi:hypothetical protein